MEATCNVHRPHIKVGKDAEEEESYLLRTRVLRASLSMSSAMMINGFLCVLASSRAGMIDWTVEIFFSQNRISASWNSLLAPDGENIDIRNQGSHNIHVTKFKAFSRPFQGLIIFFKAKQNWKNNRFITKCVSLKAYIYWLAHYVMQ